jgi:hypothetical protein
MKPLLDGIICAFHAGSSHDAEAAQRLSIVLQRDAEEISAALGAAQWAAVGSRHLVRPFGTAGVQWNPADEYLMAAEIAVAPDGDDTNWAIYGSLHAVTAKQRAADSPRPT